MRQYQKIFIVTIAAAINLILPNILKADSEPRIGVIGDSYSDEYLFYPPDRTHARNWVELLHFKRNLNFGEFSESSRGKPRNQGFAFNWAQDGDTTSDAILDGQAKGLAAQITQGQVNLVIIFIGGNDFTNALKSTTLIDNPNTIVQTAISNVLNLINTVEITSDVKVILATLPNISFLPLIQDMVKEHLISEELLQKIDLAIAEYNNELTEIASKDKRIEVADLATITKDLLSRRLLSVSGKKVNRKVASNKFQNLFLADGVHIGTIGQALIANEFIDSINKQLGIKIKRFKNSEIIHIARTVQHFP